MLNNTPTSDSHASVSRCSAAVHNAIVDRGTFFGLGRRGAPMKIRRWLRRAEECRRTVVFVEERTAEQVELEKRRALDARHGFLPMAGRRTA